MEGVEVDGEEGEEGVEGSGQGEDNIQQGAEGCGISSESIGEKR